MCIRDRINYLGRRPAPVWRHIRLIPLKSSCIRLSNGLILYIWQITDGRRLRKTGAVENEAHQRLSKSGRFHLMEMDRCPPGGLQPPETSNAGFFVLIFGIAKNDLNLCN